MPFIQILPVELRNKIAAGEVIERPASVVKELIENSIDAGSTEIRVEILNGGKGLIRVSDNGTGMDREDALLSIQRHATSKLRSEKDLFNINTMGFRGEALPSISAVSRMRIITGMKDRESGTLINIEGGEVREIRDYPAVGTVVEVRDLFFNTPVRKKFLRSDATEVIHIIECVTLEALSHQEIGFSLYIDHKETIQLSPSRDVRERISWIYGKEFLDGLLEIKAEKDGIRMTAYVSRDGNFRNRRSHQFIFVNRRPVKEPMLSHALYQAYDSIPKERHPLFFLYLTINPHDVDVNVHPAKREVRFSDRDRIYRFVRDTVREKIGRAKKEFVKDFMGREIRPDINNPVEQVEKIPGHITPSPHHPATCISEETDFTYRPSIPFIYIGETFIALSGRNGLVLLDHHAAHERVLYERFLKGKDIDSFRLLFPKQVRLSAAEYHVILNNAPIINEMGIEIEDFGHDTVIVRSLPLSLKDADLKVLLGDLAAAIAEGDKPGRSLREKIAAKMACHNSIRGSTILTHQELQALINDLEDTEDPDHCPHGRPTRIFISIDDLRRMFKRPLR